ncbi:MAG: glycosyltransferase family A protein [Leclercia adecarboxylata]|nr:glycosyltransferase family A protein [uncultured Leclercia sp.]MDU4840047.1 glycosyltransferase family A protein [Leclercia adecarboxylata]
MATLHFAELSEYVFSIAILITDGEEDEPRYISDKIIIYSRNFGAGYNLAIVNGGYDQIAARNYLMDKLSDTDVDWLMMHDADDVYHHEYYRYISERCIEADAVTCSCFTVRFGPEICVPQLKKKYVKGTVLYDPHTRIWKKNLGLRFKKSEGVEKHFVNHSRHCGVVFPNEINILCIDGLYHFHLHALFNKRHSEKIANYIRLDCLLPETIDSFLKTNSGIFS